MPGSRGPAVVEQAIFANHSGLRMIASSVDYPMINAEWEAKLVPFARLGSMAGGPLPSFALSYFVLGADEVAVLYRWAEEGGTPWRNPARALVGSPNVLAVPVALGLINWTGWRQYLPHQRLEPFDAGGIVDASESEVVRLRDVARRYSVLLERVVGQLIDHRDAKLGILGCTPELAAAITLAVQEIADPYLVKRFNERRDWTFSTYEASYGSGFPEIVFSPIRPDGPDPDRRIVIVPESENPVSQQARSEAERLVQRFLTADDSDRVVQKAPLQIVSSDLIVLPPYQPEGRATSSSGSPPRSVLLPNRDDDRTPYPPAVAVPAGGGAPLPSSASPPNRGADQTVYPYPPYSPVAAVPTSGSRPVDAPQGEPLAVPAPTPPPSPAASGRAGAPHRATAATPRPPAGWYALDGHPDRYRWDGEAWTGTPWTRPGGVFISYSRRDEEAVRDLVADLRAAGLPVWFDEEIETGQAWWEEILRQIHSAAVFVHVISAPALRSEPCRAERDYADRLGLPVVPVLIADADLRPTCYGARQLVDYRSPDRRRTARLVADVSNGIRRRVPLPDPLPEPPEAPFGYLLRIAADLDKPALDGETQLGLLHELIGYRSDAPEPGVLTSVDGLLRRLATRKDVLHSVAVIAHRELDASPPPSRPAATDFAAAGGSRSRPDSGAAGSGRPARRPRRW